MKSVILGGVLACLSGCFSSALAITTTYTYTGADYTTYFAGINGEPLPGLTLDQFRALLPGIYGPRLTGSITFEGDTSALTGTISPLSFGDIFTAGGRVPQNVR
jgi:hypothetical protein